MPRFRHLFALLAAAFLAAGCQKQEPQDSRLQFPTELVKAASSQGLKKIFVNPGARPVFQNAIAALAPASPGDAMAVQAPTLWRKLDRARRFDAVLLAGPTGEFQPLLTHLAESPDFRLERVDNWGVLFVRGTPAPYVPPDIGSLPKFPDEKQRGVFLAEMALMLDASGATSTASEFMKAAMDCAPEEPVVLVRAAALALARKRHAEALKYAGRALELHPHDLDALQIEARAYAALGAAARAWEIATELKSLAPSDDMNVLFLHARMASEAHAYAAEADSLDSLIQLAEKKGLPTTDYRVYLGQCYAHQGMARPALEQFELALKDPSISAEQRADLTTAAATVRSRAGALSQ